MRRLLGLLLLCLGCLGGLRSDSAPVAVAVTAYTHSGQPTASGAWPQPGHVALSRDLERDLGLRFGALVHLEGLGTYRVADRMHRRWTRRVDVYLPTAAQARRFGVRRTTLTVVSPP